MKLKHRLPQPQICALDDLRVDYLGKKGRVTGLLKGLGALSKKSVLLPVPRSTRSSRRFRA